MNKENPLPRFSLATALITPFRNGKIDFISLERIIERQIAASVPALVVCGTTGEPCSLDGTERDMLIDAVIRFADSRATVIAGTGSNNTPHACALTKRAKELGCDGALVVTPYYNRATDEGLVAHYAAISDAADIPIIVYNVPSRTGTDVGEGVWQRLAGLKNTAAVKEASQSFSGLLRALDECGGIDVYCGNDSYALAAICCGASGLISVASNLVPERMLAIVTDALGGNISSAREHDRELHGLYGALFCDVSPAPVKYAMSLAGLCESEMRLPLTVPDASCRRRIRRVMEELRHF